MYIERLQVRNVRLLAEQELSFLREDGKPRLWTVIVGENGLCKSTILQSIALTALGPKLATALAQDAQRFRNIEAEEAAVLTATFRDPTGEPLLSSLAIEPGRHDLVGDTEGAQRLDEVRAYRRPGWFVAGYGVGRFLAQPGEVALPLDPVVDRVEGLFDWRHKMLGLEFSAAFGKGRLAKRFFNALSRILLTQDEQGGAILPGLTSVPWRLETASARFGLTAGGRKLAIPVHWLSDGYQAMIAWIADLLGQAIMDQGTAVKTAELEGIVLLDEIDLHLHPTWQRHIVPILKRVFPKLQFVVTTHSPLVLAGFEKEEILMLKLKDGQVVQDPAGIEPGILTASEILTNFFEVHHAGRPELVVKERRYLELKGLRSLKPVETTELQDLEHELEPYWTGSGPEEQLLSPQDALRRG